MEATKRSRTCDNGRGSVQAERFSFSCAMLVAPMIALVTWLWSRAQASANCVGVYPCFSATSA